MTTEEENELICERLLGWTQDGYEDRIGEFWRKPSGEMHYGPVPNLLTGNDMLLILEALGARKVSWSLGSALLTDNVRGVGMSINGFRIAVTRGNAPAAVRAAALAYIGSMQ